MKKTYQKPEVVIVTVKPEMMLDSSPYTNFEQGFSLGDVESTDATSGNLSKDRGEDFGDLW